MEYTTLTDGTTVGLGCWVESHQGIYATGEVNDIIAQVLHIPLERPETEEDKEPASEWEVAYNDELIDKLNAALPENVHAGWWDGEFFVMPAPWWEEM